MGTSLVIQQVSGESEFQVTRKDPFKTSKPVTLPSPYTWPVEGRPTSNLMVELQWYLEKFLEYPYPPETEHAERVLQALKLWGEKAFEALFANLSGGSLFQSATAADYSALTLQVASDDAGVLSWPWEALRDPRLGTALAHACSSGAYRRFWTPPQCRQIFPRTASTFCSWWPVPMGTTTCAIAASPDRWWN